MINEKFFPKVTRLGEVTLTDAPLSYNIGNGSKESERYSKFHHHLAYKIRDIKGLKRSICTDRYLVGYLLKSIGQFVEYCLLCGNSWVTFLASNFSKWICY